MLCRHSTRALTGSRHVIHAVVTPLPSQKAENIDGQNSEDSKGDGQSHVQGDVSLHFGARRWNIQVDVSPRSVWVAQ
jgi:hypothetical protein